MHLIVCQVQPLALHPAQEIAGKIQIFAFAGGAIELHQRHLEFGMPGERGPFGGTEVLDQVIGVTDAAVQQFAVPGSAIVGDGRLQQMPQAIQLVRAVHLRESLVLLSST